MSRIMKSLFPVRSRIRWMNFCGLKRLRSLSSDARLTLMRSITTGHDWASAVSHRRRFSPQVSAEGCELGDLGVERLDPVLQAFRLREALRRAVLLVLRP